MQKQGDVQNYIKDSYYHISVKTNLPSPEDKISGLGKFVLIDTHV